MKKEDLKYGNVVETRNGDRYLYHTLSPIAFIGLINGSQYICIEQFKNNFECIYNGEKFRQFDIVKVYEDYTCQKVLWGRKEKPKLTEDEKVILRNLPKECKYIARDREGDLYVHLLLPRKEWGQWMSKGSIKSLGVYNHLFNFIKWEDEEPYLISDLLEE